MSRRVATLTLVIGLFGVTSVIAQTGSPRKRSDPPVIHSSWDDLLEGVSTAEDWANRRNILQQRFLDLIRDDEKPTRPPLNLKWHKSTVVDGLYTRWLVSYQVEADERAHAFLGIPVKLEDNGRNPAIVALHGTYRHGKELAAGLEDNPDKAFLDQLCRRGYIVIAPDHFVAGHRIPPEGSYDTRRFYKKHPEWTAVGKFTYEHSIAIDAIVSLKQVDAERIGVVGHSLGGQGSIFLAAYDPRVKVAVSNCAAPTFRHNPRVKDWARDRWYVYFKHLRPGLLRGELPPIDFHEIMALTAPRALLDVSAVNDGNHLTQRQRVLMLMKVMDVYGLLGVPGQFAFFVHGQGHAVPHESRALIFGWLDTHLKPESTKTRLVTRPR